MMHPAAKLLALALLAASPSLASPGPLSEVIVTVSEDEQPLAAVLKKLQEAHGLNYVVSQEVLKQAGMVTVHLKDVPLDVALESICAGCGLRLEVRGPVLVISQRGKDEPALPRVDARLPEPVESEPGRPPAPEPQRSRLDEADLAQAVGTLVLVDPKNRLVQLRVEGVKRDFYLPDKDDLSLPGDQVSRLEQSLSTLKPNTRIALLYRRHATRPVVTDLVGGAFNDTPQARRDRARRSRKPRPEADVAPVATPTESKADLLLEQLKEHEAERLVREAAGPGDPAEGEEKLEGTVKVVPSGPQAGPGAAPERAGPGAPTAEGMLGGAFQGLSGEEVSLTRSSDGSAVVCLLPKDEPQSAERRRKVLATLGELQPGAKLFVLYQEVDGKKYITGAVSQATR